MKLLGAPGAMGIRSGHVFLSESQNPERGAALRAYLVDELTPAFAQLDFLDAIDRISKREASLSSRGISREFRRRPPF